MAARHDRGGRGVAVPVGLPPAGARIFVLFCLAASLAAGERFSPDAFQNWNLKEAVELLNSSPWARTETFTRVVGGVGSGVSGEKEIYNSFYVRLLSAQPIRAAYLRIQQIRHGYDRLEPTEKERFDAETRTLVDLDVEDWIVVTVSFRSNDPNEESRVRQFFESAVVESLRNKAFLSSDSFSQVELAAYFAPSEESVGAKFIFPRRLEGVDIFSPEDRQLTFELLELPGADSDSGSGESRSRRRVQERSQEGGVLRASFPMEAMIVDDELIY